MVELLVQRGAVVNLQNEKGESALMMAGKNGHTEAVKFLLEKGAEADLKNGAGESALMLASQAGHYGIADLLRAVATEPDISVCSLPPRKVVLKW